MIATETKRMKWDPFAVVHFFGSVARFSAEVEKYLVFSNLSVHVIQVFQV